MGNTLRKSLLAAAVGTALLTGSITSATATEAPAAVSAAAKSYIITFIEPGLMHYHGAVGGLRATAPQARGEHELDVHSDAAEAYAQYLAGKRQSHLDAIENTLGRGLAVSHSYRVLMNGMAATLTAAEADAIAALPGVKSVRPAGMEHLVTYRGPTFIGADTIWDGSAVPSGIGTRGEGVTIAILDGGTNFGHPSFANDPSCGFSAANPKLTAVDCTSTDTSGLCNGANPEDTSTGHGVHTSSTAAGNTIDNTVTPAPNLPDGVTMSGVAPCASINSYKVCAGTGCSGAAIVAGIENAIADQVDVINFSISGGINPWSNSASDRHFLDALNAGIFTAASAGNTRASTPDPVGEVNHLGPWLMTVAASTQDRMVGPVLTVTAPGIPPDAVTSIALNPGSSSPAMPVLSGKPIETYAANLLGCDANGGIPGGTFTGSIAVLRRGDCSFVEKITNAANAGADMVVIANNVGGPLNMNTDGAPAVPNFSIFKANGDVLIDFLLANPTNATADTDPLGIGRIQGDILADFSFRGPTSAPLANLTKPNITAPGVNIYAALNDASGYYGFFSGTSMSSPHVAGAAALVVAVHPDWSVSEVKSALQTTAWTFGTQEDGATPWTPDQVGSGRVDLSMAALAGLTLDETYADYLAANPDGGSIPLTELNLPALRNVTCSPSCTWTRTVTNQLSVAGTWSATFISTSGPSFSAMVMPQTFTLAPGASKTLTFAAAPRIGDTMEEIGFGRILFAEGGGLSPDQHFSVAIQGEGAPIPPGDIIFQDGFEPTFVDFALDDGDYDGIFGWQDSNGTTEYAALYLNRFTPNPANFPIELASVDILWPIAFPGGDVSGKQGTILVYVDQDGDGDPANATLVGQASFTISTLNSFESYPINATLSGGDVYVGFRSTWAATGSTPPTSPGAIDANNPAGRSWLFANSDFSAPDINNLGNNDVSGIIGTGGPFGNLQGNWMIRAHGTATTGTPITLD